MTVKEYMDENENIPVIIQRLYAESADWASTLYKGMLHDVPSALRKEEILNVEYMKDSENAIILVSKKRKFFQVVLKFNTDLEEAIISRAGEFGVPVGSYIKSLVMKDLEEAQK